MAAPPCADLRCAVSADAAALHSLTGHRRQHPGRGQRGWARGPLPLPTRHVQPQRRQRHRGHQRQRGDPVQPWWAGRANTASSSQAASGLITGNEIRSVNRDGTACRGDGAFYLGGGSGWTVRTKPASSMPAAPGVGVMSASPPSIPTRSPATAWPASELHGVHIMLRATVQRSDDPGQLGRGHWPCPAATARISQNSIWGNGSIVNRSGASRRRLAGHRPGRGGRVRQRWRGQRRPGQQRHGLLRLTLNHGRGPASTCAATWAPRRGERVAAATIEVHKSGSDASGFGQAAHLPGHAQCRRQRQLAASSLCPAG